MRDESALIRRAVNGDGEAFAALASMHRGLVYASSYSVLWNREDAEDAAQEAIVRMFVHIASFREDGSFARWAHIIAKNTAIARLRSRSREVPLDPDATYSHTSHFESSIDLGEALTRLPERLREPFVMHYVAGYSGREIAECLGMPQGTVRRRLFEARQVLQKELTEMAKRKLAEFVPREKLDGLIAWLGNFPKVEPDLEITELDGVTLDPQSLQPGWDQAPLVRGGATLFGWYEYPERRYTGAAISFVLGKTELQGRECWESCDTTKCKAEPWYHLWYIAEEDAVFRVIGHYNSCDDALQTESGCYAWTTGMSRHPGRLPILDRVGPDDFTGPAGPVAALVGTYEVRLANKAQKCLRVLFVQQDASRIEESFINDEGRVVLVGIYCRLPSPPGNGVDTGSTRVDLADQCGRALRYNGVDYYHRHDVVTDVALEQPLPCSRRSL